MSNVTIYSSSRCPFCVKAKMLLDKKNIQYEEIDVTDDEEARKKLVEKANGMRTVPQIFIGETHVGGCDDLYELENKGKLDPMLAA
ncbi:glutaredoxin 3 [Desulfogranum japonicum]|uniref:glutaredoxin 3 n=1 Tax=Desulfogranum japonicum TaxID=231447 RepID=UPI0003FA5C49|nr:glutaredoxin 3 [Desulfogranum japonicum]